MEKAESDEIETRLRKVNGTRTIYLVLHFLPIAHEGSIDPIPRKYHPRNDAESVPAQVHQRSLGVPQAFPEVRCLEGVEDFRILDGGPRGRTAVLLRASEVEQIRDHWDRDRDECSAGRTAKFV